MKNMSELRMTSIASSVKIEESERRRDCTFAGVISLVAAYFGQLLCSS